MSSDELPAHVRENRDYWDARAHEWVEAGERGFREEPNWGCWEIPESQLKLLPADMSGMHAIELGCGTGYVSAWLARRGAQVVGIDNSAQQLATARRLAQAHGIELTLLHGNAEQVPYPDASFDFAISEYGAAIWCDPHLWIPEAHRLLKPGAQLVFLGNHPIATICNPLSGDKVDAQLHRDYFALHCNDWRGVAIDPGGMDFNLPISGWLKLFRDTGFEVLDYLELQAPKGRESRHNVPPAWAEKWPSEQVWKLKRI
jgi:SAM-dependent methyltransferase